jgi:hypothetical protein
MRVLIFTTNLSGTSIFIRRTQRHIIIMYIGIHVKYPLFLSDFKLEFSRQTFEKPSNIKFLENPTSEKRVLHSDIQTDGRTDR